MNIFLGIFEVVMKKGVGSGVGSGSGFISQSYGSADPDQNVTDPQHYHKLQGTMFGPSGPTAFLLFLPKKLILAKQICQQCC
jgi:hypothetical protein